MANDGFIEFLSPNALSELKQAETLINSLASSIEKINKFKAPTSPSGADGAAKQMLADLKAQEQAIKNTTNALIQEEKVKQQALATEIKQSNAIKANIAQREAERKATLAQQQAQEKAAKSAEREALANQRLNSAYNQLNAARTRAKNVLRDLIASETASNAEIRKAQREFDILDKKVRRADQAVGDFSKRVGNYKTALSGVGNLMGAFGIATGLYLAVDIGRNIFETTKKLESMGLALKLVSETTQGLAQNQAFLANISEKWGLDIIKTTEQFIAFYADAKGKLSSAEIEEVFEGIAKAGALMGLSIQKQENAFLAFQQMLSKGTIQAQELKQQLGDALPGSIKVATAAYQKLHPELKVTEQLLYKHMEQGLLISSEMIPEMVRGYQKLYGIEHKENTDTIISAQNRLFNTWTALIKSMNESETGGISKFFSMVIIGLDEILEKILRVNSSWSDLMKNAKQEGIAQGKIEFKFFMDDLYKPLTDAEKQKIKEKIAELNKIINSESQEGAAQARGERQSLLDKLYYSDPEKVKADIKAAASDRIKLLKEQELKVIKELAEFRENAFKAAITYGRSQSEAYAEKERLTREINAEAEVIRQANAKIKDLGSNKPVVKIETDAERKAREKAAKDAAQAEEQRRKDQYNLEISNIEREIERAKDKFNIVQELNKNELGYFENGVAKKMKLSMDLAILELKLAQKVADEKKRLAQGNKALGISPTIGGDIIAENEYATESVNIAENYTNRMDKINKDYFKSMEEAVPKDLFGDMYKMTDEQKENLKEHEDKVKKAADRLKEIQDEFRNYIQSFGQDFFGNAGFGETFDFFLRMDEYGDTMFDKLNAKGLDAKQKFAATFQAISESAQEAFNFISEASQRNFEAEYNRLEEQKNVALLFAGESTEARAEIEEQYEQRRKEIARREAKAKKQQAIFNIAIDTAQGIMAAVMKSPLTGGLPWSAIVAAIGAAQIAMVSSQEIPQYWKGTDNAEGGLAWTQERGREIITDSQGRVKSLGSDKGAELTMLSKGDKVFTAEKSAMMFDDSLNGMLLNNGIVMPKIEVSMDAQKITNEIKSLANTIALKESFSIVRDAKGERVYQRKQNERKELLNNILNVKTYGV